MYKDTEQSYLGYTLDVYQSVHTQEWIVDWWRSGALEGRGSVRHKKRESALGEAKAKIRSLSKRSK